ncbi:hypothetical protein HPB48_023191 [Haemaphysalis longicornis]|uniref:Uncharacterized protein n=1 Tax=Haemaphysalis longicornis TaxID=44386 RepID=A0A9J6GVY8_HAELO|nr:hypothetical protein HPB48_023191 [Haemaphysalis longicornis]
MLPATGAAVCLPPPTPLLGQPSGDPPGPATEPGIIAASIVAASSGPPAASSPCSSDPGPSGTSLPPGQQPLPDDMDDFSDITDSTSGTIIYGNENASQNEKSQPFQPAVPEKRHQRRGGLSGLTGSSTRAKAAAPCGTSTGRALSSSSAYSNSQARGTTCIYRGARDSTGYDSNYTVFSLCSLSEVVAVHVRLPRGTVILVSMYIRPAPSARIRLGWFAHLRRAYPGVPILVGASQRSFHAYPHDYYKFSRSDVVDGKSDALLAGTARRLGQ